MVGYLYPASGLHLVGQRVQRLADLRQFGAVLGSRRDSVGRVRPLHQGCSVAQPPEWMSQCCRHSPGERTGCGSQHQPGNQDHGARPADIGRGAQHQPGDGDDGQRGGHADG
jgi:hypothetical protein